jgi:hypothetical protein
MTMAVPPATRERPGRREWTRFQGLILNRVGDEVTLEPASAQGARLVVHAMDVRQAGQNVLIRPGSRYLRLDIVDRNAYRALPIGQATAACAEGSRCIGNVRYCCGSGEEAGSCNGNSRCPDDY